MEWISVNDRLPELHQTVAFVVDSQREYYHGRVFGGTYQGFSVFKYHAFSVPGIEFAGSHWMPLPPPPIKQE